MTTYTMPEDKFDYCVSCNYLEEVVAVAYLDQDDTEAPVCKECAEIIPCEYLPEIKEEN